MDIYRSTCLLSISSQCINNNISVIWFDKCLLIVVCAIQVIRPQCVFIYLYPLVVPTQCVSGFQWHCKNLWFWHKSWMEWEEHKDVICWYSGMDGPGGHTQWNVQWKSGHMVSSYNFLMSFKNIFKNLIS